MGVAELVSKHSNTSYVLIHPKFICFLIIHYADSNTSYVLIHPTLRWEQYQVIPYSNTSYVLIHQEAHSLTAIRLGFKYILCSYSSNVFTPFHIFIIITFPLLYNLFHKFYQVFPSIPYTSCFFPAIPVFTSKIPQYAIFPPGKFHKINVSPFSLSCTPITSSPNTPSFINLIIHIKSSSS